ncbi:hypothetical protein KAFR_0K00380 [Kazachstania africana CBS 2517]|uniref:AP-3 complex subunit delta n=1 Tax=Kazachstania africana (strain ATCC 22294 / BCRC 22015 / CBS 2517 / CECT 1963 / NBRC 1671 / NRRL Y-8276) TaxID=1071382 RepID=H2B193_KAZAF|nr:hypothetical protein KAFR_0K00380 [Kazachstania africana CBS 2517]CCF60393.1 hypothetical protein KAFR_0K00380 [Kazachstania africana CBS 2517]
MTSLYAPTADDVRQRLRPFGFFFEKSLKDLIKGIRSNNETPEKLHNFLNQQLTECRNEANQSDLNIKANAVLKLAYLEMYGFDMSWCNFHILEVMSSSRLQHKRVGYLAASQSFYKDADVLMLATNLIRKDLKFTGDNDTLKVGIALSGLSSIVSPSLAADIAEDLLPMLNSTNPYIRKKTVTALFKVFLQYPEALKDNFTNFVAKLEDDDISVVSATVSVICELSKKNPAPFIQLSPLLYQILVSIDNNWIIIRLLKLFTNLSKIEPKLKFKLLPKILELMDSTMATSVLYESINCIVRGNMLDVDDFDSAIQCLDRLHTFCDSQDPNLRYISCVLFYKIGKINTDFISHFDDLVIRLIGDVDISIRSKALELLEGIVDEENLKKIVVILMKQFVNQDVVVLQDSMSISREIPIIMSEPYKVKMVDTILKICQLNNYSNIPDFEWFNAVLYDLAILSQDLAAKELGYKIGEQIKNIMVKVPDMRGTTISTIIKLISVDTIDNQLPTILKDCIWSLGEYSGYIENGDALVRLLVKRGCDFRLDAQSVLITALLKIFSYWSNSNIEREVNEVKLLLEELVAFLQELSFSKSFEVQERSVEVLEILNLVLESMTPSDTELSLLLTDVIPSFFNAYELTPIAHGTQKQLNYTGQLDLETPFLTDFELQEILNQPKYSENIDYVDSDETDIELKESTDFTSFGNENEENNGIDISSTEKFSGNKKIDNMYYLNEEDQEVEKSRKSDDLLSVGGCESQSTDFDIIRLTTKPSGPKEKKKKHKKKAKKVKVLSDEIVVDSNTSDMNEGKRIQVPHSLSKSPEHKINLKTHSKLEDYDFSHNALANVSDRDPNKIEDQAELEKLREKFANQTLEKQNDVDDDDAEEVIVIKRKKKKASGDKKMRKGKKPSKTSETLSSTEEGTAANDSKAVKEQVPTQAK